MIRKLMIDRSDIDLIALTRTGDKAAFGQLIERHQPMVKHITSKMVRDSRLAQELIQEAFLQAYLSLDRLRDDARFQSWLYGITLNVCKNHLRQQKTDFLSLESLVGGMRVDPALLARGTPDPETVVEQRELHRLVLAAVNALSPKNRDATLLFYFEQLTVAEIAALLQISISAVKGRLHRSREQLKLRLLSLYPETDHLLPDQPLQEQTLQIPEIQMPERKRDMVKITVADVVKQKTEEDTHCVVILLDKAAKRLLMMWVGQAEGASMALNLLEHSVPRPMTYTFIANLLEASGVELEAVSVSALKGDTFYATVTVRVGEAVREIDARPSDAINLALYMGCPIYVAESVMETAGIDISDQDALPKGLGLEQLQLDFEAWTQRIEERKHSLADLTEEERSAKSAEAHEKLVSFVLGAEVS
jgi:RNA polymerase sigma factor (sigma-70 family)